MSLQKSTTMIWLHMPGETFVIIISSLALIIYLSSDDQNDIAKIEVGILLKKINIEFFNNSDKDKNLVVNDTTREQCKDCLSKAKDTKAPQCFHCLKVAEKEVRTKLEELYKGYPKWRKEKKKTT